VKNERVLTIEWKFKYERNKEVRNLTCILVGYFLSGSYPYKRFFFYCVYVKRGKKESDIKRTL